MKSEEKDCRLACGLCILCTIVAVAVAVIFLLIANHRDLHTLECGAFSGVPFTQQTEVFVCAEGMKLAGTCVDLPLPVIPNMADKEKRHRRGHEEGDELRMCQPEPFYVDGQSFAAEPVFAEPCHTRHCAADNSCVCDKRICTRLLTNVSPSVEVVFECTE